MAKIPTEKQLVRLYHCARALGRAYIEAFTAKGDQRQAHAAHEKRLRVLMGRKGYRRAFGSTR